MGYQPSPLVLPKPKLARGTISVAAVLLIVLSELRLPLLVPILMQHVQILDIETLDQPKSNSIYRI